MEEWITAMEASERTGIPTPSIRRYMSIHKRFLRIKRQHKSYYLHTDCIKVFNKVRDLYQKGKTQQEVDDILAYEGMPSVINMVDEEGMRDTVEVGEIVAEIKASLDEQKVFNEELLKMVKLQSQKLDEQEKLLKEQRVYIETSLKSRDEQLMLSLRELQQSKMLAASAQEENKKEDAIHTISNNEVKKEPWFKRFFK